MSLLLLLLLLYHIGAFIFVRQEFQEDAALWEERLTKLNAVLDAWVDVQRRWLYLEGIFFASRDIKQQLPSEYAVSFL